MAANGMGKHRSITIERLEKYIQTGQFSDVNLAAVLWDVKDSAAVHMTMFSVPGLARIPFAEAVKGEFKPAAVGARIGPSWSTHWFHLSIVIPASMDGKRVVLLFDPGCEALVWSTAGEPLQGFTGGTGFDRHVDFVVSESGKAGERLEYYIEVAANGMFGAGAGNMIFPPDPDKYFTLETVQIAAPNLTAHALWWDFEVLIGMIKELPADSQAGADALYTANKMVNLIRPDHPETLNEAKAVATDFFQKRAQYGYNEHTIVAVGNCHIDTAWLWPYDETKRKAARSWATQCTLIETYPDYTFAASQAQQFEWMDQLYPALMTRIQRHVKTGQFIPIGGTWVEMDCNIPSGEAFCRQFLYGQNYFKERFGKRCSVFWLPDTFGYSAQLPQIVREADLKYFFTQKLSWNLFNKFPHTTFMWKGLDGTSVLTHFCPADTYTAGATVRDVTFSVKNNKDKEYTTKSLLLYGNGDGGGGPLIPMIERLQRMKSVKGLPANVEFGDPTAFYDSLAATGRDMATWTGELYFELHRGTYTTHALVKRYNRMTELLLREVELLHSLHLIQGTGYENPKHEMDRLWKLVLLNQFHDVLPGSSIGMVYVDAIKFYEDVVATGLKLKENALSALLLKKSSASKSSAAGSKHALAVLNATSWDRLEETIELDTKDVVEKLGVDVETAVKAGKLQIAANRSRVVMALDHVPAMSISTISSELLPPTKMAASQVIVNANVVDKSIVIANEFLRATFDANGRLTSLEDLVEGRQLVPPGSLGNVFKYFEDIPLFWDAWDVEVYHLEKTWAAGTGSVSVIENGPLRVVLRALHQLSPNSTLEQRIILAAGSRQLVFENDVFWDENRKILKVEFPWNIASDVATYETQFGVVQRPTHYNTSWDLARFEVCGHKFVDFSEYGYGVALLNDCKYGFAVHDNVMRMSVLRSPKAPDDQCDVGRHSFRYALYPHKGSFGESDVVKAGYTFNVPLTATISPVHETWPAAAPGSAATQFFTVDCPNVVLDTVKIAETSSKGVSRVVLRLYEAYGGRGTVSVHSLARVVDAAIGNVLEDVKGTVEVVDGHTLRVPFTPFKIMTLILTF